MDFNIGGEARDHVLNALVYTQMKSFRGFNIGSPYQNCQSAKLKVHEIYVLYGIFSSPVSFSPPCQLELYCCGKHENKLLYY